MKAECFFFFRGPNLREERKKQQACLWPSMHIEVQHFQPPAHTFFNEYIAIAVRQALPIGMSGALIGGP